MLLAPAASVTVVLHEPLDCTVAVPSAACVPLSYRSTVVPLTSVSLVSVTVPLIIWLAWLVAPPVLVIATAGVVVSSV